MKIKLATEFDDNYFKELEAEAGSILTANILIEELKKCNPDAPIAFKRWEDSSHTYLSGITQRQIVLIDDGQEYMLSRDDESDALESYPVIFLTE